MISMDSQIFFQNSYEADASLESSRMKRRKIEAESHSSETEVKWRSESTQRIYAVKLVEALKRTSSRNDPPTPSAAAGERAVRDVADRVLAMAAKGRTRWSRAILASRLRFTRLRRHRKVKKPSSSAGRPRKLLPAAADGQKKRFPAVENRVKVLSRLVPGCRGIPVANLLEEAGDYIAALQMQVRAMTALTEIISLSQDDRLGSSSSSQA